ncbi:unnamed protein product [Paramecium primaurelia]|uniref:Uncharacterized protein n=1 Tax=Paramecium primaurelia TaxID=5886 RepID=A0A8S1N9R4_PARPR|nr:unnamed protein product [Paramecium primaurelia]
MIFAMLFGFALFGTIVYHTRSNSNSYSRQQIETDQYINKKEILQLIQTHLSDSIRSLEKQDITINYQYIDQWFLKANLTYINLINFKYDVEQIDIQFEYNNNSLLLMLPIQQFDLMAHFELWNIYSNSTRQLSFQFRVQDTYMKIRFKINGVKIQFVDDWFPKFKFGSFKIVVDEEIQEYKKAKKIIDWLLYKFHSTIENILVQKLMKSLDMDQLNIEFQSNENTKKVINLQLHDSQTLKMRVYMHPNEVFRLGDFKYQKQN